MLAVLFLIAAVIVLRVGYNGPPLASFVERTVNDRIQGKVEIGSIEWPLDSLHRVVVGGWIPVEIHDLTVYDDTHERVLLKTKHATAKIDAHSVIFGRHDVVLKDIALPQGGHCLIRQVPEPFPTHEYDEDVVSIVSAFYSKRVTSFYAGVSAAPSTVFDLRNFTITNANLEFEFGGFHAILYNVNARDGFLYSDGSDPLSKKLYYSLLPHAERALVTVQGKTIELFDIKAEQLEQIPLDSWPRDPIAHDFDFKISARTVEGAVLNFEGAIDDYWQNYFSGDYAIEMRVEEAGPLVAEISDGHASGDELKLKVGISGPALGPRIDVALEALDIAVPVSDQAPPLDLHLASTHLTFDLATYSGSLDNTVARGAGGEVQMAASFQINPYLFDAKVDITQPINVGPYLPAEVARLAGTRLHGHLHARGNGDVQEIDDIDLWLGQARLKGKLYHEKERVIHANRLVVSLGQTNISTRGWVDLAAQKLDLSLSVDSNDAERFLRQFAVPALARTLDGNARVDGSFDNPRATAVLTAGGVPALGTVTSKLAYSNGLLSVLDASSRRLGGRISANGKVRLTPHVRVVTFDASAADLDLSKLPGAATLLAGIATARLHAEGPSARLTATADASIAGLEIAGDDYAGFTLTGTMDDSGTRSVELHLDRDAGGKLDLIAALDADDEISGVLSLRALPIDTFTALDAPLGGTLDTDLRLGGRADAISLDGTLSLVQAWFGQAFLGAASLTVDHGDDGKMHLSGHMFQGKLKIDGTIAGSAPYLADLKLRVKRVEVDQFFPEFAEKWGVRGWVTGEIGLKSALLPGPEDKPEITLDLSEAMVVVDNQDLKGRPAPLRVRNRTPISIVFDGTTATLLTPTVFRGPAGDFTVSGGGSADQLAIHVDGDIAVQLLEPYLREYFDEMSGTLAVGVDVTGALSAARVAGSVDIDKISVRPTGQEAVVSIPSGKVEVTNDQVVVTGVTISVVDSYGDERSELNVSGGIKMRDFVPRLWALQVDGQLAGKMLLVAAPASFSAAGGMANLSLSLHGIGEIPNIDGSLSFKTGRPLSITPRGVGHEISLTEGALTFTDQSIGLEEVGGLIDGEGRIIAINGVVGLENWRPIDIDVTGSAQALSFRVPEQLDMTLNLSEVRIVGGEQGLDISGAVVIVDGRYTRKFNMVNEVLAPARTTEVSTPFYKTNPLIADAVLDLTLGVRGFYVRNNVANVELNGAIEVSGTPSDPKFDGEITVEQGTFKFPILRPTFTRTNGSVTFSPRHRFPDNTPELMVRSESDYRDLGGQEHQIFLELTGTLNNLNWDLYTASGLNKAQTMMLVLAGRTTEDVRQTLGDEAIGNPNDISRTTDAGNVYDQVVKDVAGDFISLLIEDKLKDFTKLDVARLEIGTSSFGFHAEKDFFKNLRALGDFEKTTSGVTVDVRGELRISEGWSAEGEFLDKDYYDDSEDDIRETRLRSVWRWELQ